MTRFNAWSKQFQWRDQIRTGLTCSVDSLPHFHVFLLMLHTSESSRQLIDHLFQFIMIGWRRNKHVSHCGERQAWLSHVEDVLWPSTFAVFIHVHFGLLSNVHAEHNNLGCHGGHLVAEAVLVDTIHVSSKGVLAIGLPLPIVDVLTIWANDLLG